ncbi:hypothetical protein [Nannocystis punicea]|uniref:Uncharacterized protein n=1 Tax=Nannocystis punicea TaxID=2995304 RepID=A0ABY7HIC1_9BACT|nr:hypothetical protein [Nannocystis poenicansa]WAS98815.1 hypothetical protein O0S08_22015 [Nannocystis poenicansa]
MRALALVPFVALLACAVTYPPGWPAGEQQPQVVQATTGVSYGAAPVSWDLPEGAQIRIDVARRSVSSGMGAYVADIQFAAAYVDDPDLGIDCATEPTGPGVPRTRFGCWSRADPAALRFWMAPGADCPARHVGAARTLLRPECWQGELEVHGRRLQLRHGFLGSSRVPASSVSWIDEHEQGLLAADFVRKQQLHLFDGSTPPPPELRRTLVLLTVALGWWEDASSPD